MYLCFWKLFTSETQNENAISEELEKIATKNLICNVNYICGIIRNTSIESDIVRYYFEIYPFTYRYVFTI